MVMSPSFLFFKKLLLFLSGQKTLAMKRFLLPSLLSFLLFVANLSYAQNYQHYHVDNTTRIDRSPCPSIIRLSVLMPYPETNQYQTISNISYPYGELLTDETTNNRYVRFLYNSQQLQGFGSIIDNTISFDATLLPVHFDFSQVDQIYPYDYDSPECYMNLGASDIYVDPNNPTIIAIADEIWAHSTDYIDYARQCYEYVASHYSYLNPYTGMHPLSELLANGGGDCGNLSSIYISLLRNKSIPSRHVMAILPFNGYHIWAEFYLEQYGWIPVDVTYKNSNPAGDFFGHYYGNAIVVSKGLFLTLEKIPGLSYQAVFLQTYEYWYWYTNSGTCNGVDHQLIVNSYPISEVEELEDQRLALYPNPTNGIVRIKDSGFREIRVYNTLGVLVRCFNTKGDDDTEIDLSDLPNGIYVLHASNESLHLTRQVVKMN